MTIIAGDFLLLWSLNRRTSEGKFLCDFTSQKVWIILWQILNVIGIVGLLILIGQSYNHNQPPRATADPQSTGWYLVTLGFWSMLYDPIHFAVFVVLCCLVPVLLYTAYILHSLYLVMGEAYIDVSNVHEQ